jgi:uncharacterized protein involved in response to NO
MLGLTQVAPAPTSLALPPGHAHEMLLGYALAVLAGYQLPALPRPRLWSLFSLWLLARVTFLAPAGVGALEALNEDFAIALAVHAAPRLARSAKKLRNQALPALIVTICAAAFAYAVVRRTGLTVAPSALATLMVLLLAGLMLFMGGRILAPMIAGDFYRRHQSLGPRVQPRIEGALLATTAVGVVAAVLAGLDTVMRIACIAACSRCSSGPRRCGVANACARHEADQEGLERGPYSCCHTACAGVDLTCIFSTSMKPPAALMTSLVDTPAMVRRERHSVRRVAPAAVPRLVATP